MLVLVAILLPWLVFFILGRTWEGFLCLILQLTVLGWIPATIWALITLSRWRRYQLALARAKHRV